MPIVRTYTNQGSLAPLPDVRRRGVPIPQLETPLIRAEPSSAAFGGQAGEAIRQMGAAFLKQSLEQVYQDDLLQAENGVRQLDEFEIQVVDHPTEGLLAKTRGKDAESLLQTVPELYRKKHAEVSNRLQNERQRELFQKLSLEGELNLSKKINAHIGREHQRWVIAENEANIKTAQAAALSNLEDLERHEDDISKIREFISGDTTLNGLGEDYRKLRTDVAVSQTRTAAVESMLSLGADDAAAFYFTRFEKQFLPDVRASLKEKLTVANAESAGMNAASEIWRSFGPKSDAEPASLDVLLEKAREAFPNDPKRYKHAADAIKEHVSAFNEGRQQRADHNEAAVWQAVEQGATLNEVRSLPQYQGIAGDRQVAISNAVVDRGYALSQRARGDEDYLFFRGQRARTLREQAEDDKTRAAYALYWDLSSTAKLSELTEAQIINKVDELGRTHTNNLLEKKRALDKAGDKVFAGTIDDDLFRELADGAGLNPFNPTQTQKGRLGYLRSHVERVIAIEEQKRGRGLTREEKRSLMQGEISNKVLLSIPYARDIEVPAGAADPRQAYVPLASIPEASRTSIENLGRSYGVKLTKDQVQRIYARSLAGDDRGIEAILREK